MVFFEPVAAVNCDMKFEPRVLYFCTPYYCRQNRGDFSAGLRIRIQSGQWIRIRIQEGKNDPTK